MPASKRRSPLKLRLWLKLHRQCELEKCCIVTLTGVSAQARIDAFVEQVFNGGLRSP